MDRSWSVVRGAHSPPPDAGERRDLAHHNAPRDGEVSHLQSNIGGPEHACLVSHGACAWQRTCLASVQHRSRPACGRLCSLLQHESWHCRAAGALRGGDPLRTRLGARPGRLVADRILRGSGHFRRIPATSPAIPLAMGTLGCLDGRWIHRPVVDGGPSRLALHVPQRGPRRGRRPGTARRSNGPLRCGPARRADGLLPICFRLSLVARADAHRRRCALSRRLGPLQRPATVEIKFQIYYNAIQRATYPPKPEKSRMHGQQIWR